MKYFLILILFLSCNNPSVKITAPKNTYLRIILDSSLPFHQIKLKTFDPIYGDYSNMDYDFKRVKDTNIFNFALNSFTQIYLRDNNDIGAGSFLIEPGENISVRLHWSNQSIKREILNAQYPGNNLFYQALNDSIRNINKKLAEEQISLTSSIDINKFVNRKIDNCVLSIRKLKDMHISFNYANFVLNPLILFEKSGEKRYLLEKSDNNDRANFYSNSGYDNPKYQYWNQSQYYTYPDFLFYVVNKGKANSLKNFIKNIQDFYRTESPDISKSFIVSQGIKAFVSHSRYENNKEHLSAILDSICLANELDKGMLNLNARFFPQSIIINEDVLNRILVKKIDNDSQLKLRDILKDTSIVYYLDYWASWCQPCIKGLPNTIKLYSKRFPNLIILFINTDTEENIFINATKKYEIPVSQSIHIIYDEKNIDAYRKLNELASIPVYQFIFFKNNQWHSQLAPSAEDPNLENGIRNLR